MSTPPPSLAPRERFTACLERRPIPGLVPTFELAFYLSMEAFGKVHHEHRNYHQWMQMEEKERRLHINDIADMYIAIAERFGHSAIKVQTGFDMATSVARVIREKTGDRYFLTMHGDPTIGIPNGSGMVDLAYRMADEPEKIHEECQARVQQVLKQAEGIAGKRLFDGFSLCSDYCFNTGTFLSPDQFSEFITPYLAEVIKGYRELGFYTIKHTDGNIMPILDQLVQAGPHALHSLDPQGGVDMAAVKKRIGDRICLIGNVDCGLMDTGPDAQVIESAQYALRHGMPGGGYIFSTSNTIYTGMRLSRYELVQDVWRKDGVWADDGVTQLAPCP